MQPNEIVLSVDEGNDGIDPVNHTFTRYEALPNRSMYIGPSHSLESRNTLSMYRTAQKPSGNFRGVAKTSFKFSKDLAVDGADGVSQLTAPLIVEVSFSIPVGATHDEILISRQKALALLDLDAVMTPLNEQLMV